MNKKTICNTALLKIGLRPIKSFNDNTKEARLATALYDFLKTEILTCHDWKFMGVENALNIKESDFPSTLTVAFISLLASEFAMSILDDERKYNLYKKEFQKQLLKAKLQDGNKQKTNTNFPLIGVRK